MTCCSPKQNCQGFALFAQIINRWGGVGSGWRAVRVKVRVGVGVRVRVGVEERVVTQVT